MDSDVLFFVLAGMAPVCVLLCQISALTGNTRALIPALAGMGSAVVPAVAGTLMLGDGGMDRGAEQLMTVLLFALPLAIFAGLFAYFQMKRRPARRILPKIRWALALLPALAGLVAGWEIALGLLLAAFGVACLFSAATGNVPVARPLLKGAVFLLNGVLLLALLREMRIGVPFSLFFMIALSAVLLAACAVAAYRPLPPGERLYPWKLAADTRWALLGAAMLVPFATTKFVGAAFPVLAAACLACVISGNTRAVLPAVAGIAASAGGVIWLAGLGPMHMGMGWLVLLVLLGLPLAMFGMGYFVSVVGGSDTRVLPKPARAALAAGCLVMLAWFVFLMAR